MANDQPPSGVTTEEIEPKRNGQAGSLGGLVLRFLSMVALLAVLWRDELNADWEAPNLVLAGLVAASLGIDGREAVDLLKSRFGAK